MISFLVIYCYLHHWRICYPWLCCRVAFLFHICLTLFL